MELYFIRHGETDWNVKKRMQGQIDISLNEKGHRQAMDRAIQMKIDHIVPDIIYSSNLKRAYQTAQDLAGTFQLPVWIQDGLEEISFGDWEGKVFQDLERENPMMMETHRNNIRYSKVHGGESYDDVTYRMLKATKQIIDRHPDQNTIFIVSHGAAILTLQMLLLNRDYRALDFSLRLDNLEYIILEGERIIHEYQRKYTD